MVGAERSYPEDSPWGAGMPHKEHPAMSVSALTCLHLFPPPSFCSSVNKAKELAFGGLNSTGGKREGAKQISGM